MWGLGLSAGADGHSAALCRSFLLMMRGLELYNYLGFMVNDQLNCARMVEETAKAGAKALSDWIRRCRVAVGELKGETFVKLLEMLVDLVLL